MRRGREPLREPSPAHRRLLAAIGRLARRGHPPTVRELARAVRRGEQTVHEQLCLLRRMGRVTWIPGAARTLRVVEVRRG